MRILPVHNRYHEPGGEERHLALLEGSLADRGHRVLRFEIDSASVESSHVSRVTMGFGSQTVRPPAACRCPKRRCLHRSELGAET